MEYWLKGQKNILQVSFTKTKTQDVLDIDTKTFTNDVEGETFLTHTRTKYIIYH